MDRDIVALIFAILLGAGWQWNGHKERWITQPPQSYVHGVFWILAGVVLRARLGETPGWNIPLVDLLAIVAGNGLFVLFSHLRDWIAARIDQAEDDGHAIERTTAA